MDGGAFVDDFLLLSINVLEVFGLVGGLECFELWVEV